MASEPAIIQRAPSQSVSWPTGMASSPPPRKVTVERNPACAGVMPRSRMMRGRSGAWLMRMKVWALVTMHGRSSEGSSRRGDSVGTLTSGKYSADSLP